MFCNDVWIVAILLQSKVWSSVQVVAGLSNAIGDVFFVGVVGLDDFRIAPVGQDSQVGRTIVVFQIVIQLFENLHGLSESHVLLDMLDVFGIHARVVLVLLDGHNVPVVVSENISEFHSRELHDRCHPNQGTLCSRFERVGVQKVYSDMKYSKTTILENYYATGDYECFCFDKHNSPEEHDKAVYTPEYWLHRLSECEIEDCSHCQVDSDECRVYPNALLPELPEVRNLKGKWTIIVEFEPEEEK